MKNHITVTFYIDDGYANPHGSPHTLHLHREDIEDYKDDLETLIDDEIRNYMANNLHPIYDIEEIREDIQEQMGHPVE